VNGSAAAPVAGIALWQRLGVSAVALASLAVLLAAWLLIGAAGRPLAFAAEGIALALLLTALVASLATTATVIVWRAQASRSTELLAWFLATLAWGSVWRLFKLDSIQDRFLEDWMVHWAAALAPSLPLIAFLRAAARVMALLDELAHLAMLVAPTLFLLFTERFPRPLTASELRQSPLHALVSAWRRSEPAAGPRRHAGAQEVLVVVAVSCAAMALALGGRSSFDLNGILLTLMFATTALALAGMLAWVLRRLERSHRPWGVERWLTDGVRDGPPVLPLSSVLILLYLSIALEAVRVMLERQARGDADDPLFEALACCALFVPPLLLRVRAARALSPAVFWAGWLALLVSSSPGLPRGFSFTSEPLGQDVVPMLCWTLVCSMAATANLAVAYAGADAVGRRRVDWLLLGIFLACVAMLVPIGHVVACALPAADCRSTASFLRWSLLAPATLLVACMLFAVFYRGAIDSRLALQRSVTYVMVGLVITAVFTGAELLLDRLLSVVSAPDVSKWIAASISFLVINPTKNGCEKAVLRATRLLARASTPPG